jgi:hypothetical protein
MNQTGTIRREAQVRVGWQPKQTGYFTAQPLRPSSRRECSSSTIVTELKRQVYCLECAGRLRATCLRGGRCWLATFQTARHFLEIPHTLLRELAPNQPGQDEITTLIVEEDR